MENVKSPDKKRDRSRSKSKTRVSLAGTRLNIDTETDNKIRKELENHFNENWLLTINSQNLKSLGLKLKNLER